MFHRNKNTTTPPISGEGFASRLLVGGFVAFMMVMILSSASAQAASPIAGQQISNQATASYTDSGGMPQTVTSNIVITTVEQVGAYTLTASQTKTAAPGTTVYLPHVLTNTGNGIDSFNISIPQALSDSAKLNSAALYLDNGTGVPSGPALCTTTGTTVCSINSGTLASNATYKFILALVVKATAADGALAAAEVITAIPASSGALLASYPTSGGTGDATYFANHSKTNSDQLTIASNLPIFALQKTFD